MNCSLSRTEGPRGRRRTYSKKFPVGVDFASSHSTRNRDADAAPGISGPGQGGDPSKAPTGRGRTGGNSSKDSPESQLASEAALSLWRHGIERDFADKETVEALRVLEAHGNTAAKGIAKRALEDLQTNFEARPLLYR